MCSDKDKKNSVFGEEVKSMKDILIIEDHMELGTIISDFLTASGLSVEVKASGEEGLEYLEKNQVKLVLLDIMLEKIDGFEVCARIRQLQTIPIIMMSALSDEESKILCLEIGADDYIEKPFTPQFLKAKINALLRRNYGFKEHNTLISVGGVTIDTSKRKVWQGDHEVVMSAKEYELLLLLLIIKIKRWKRKSYLMKFGDMIALVSLLH